MLCHNFLFKKKKNCHNLRKFSFLRENFTNTQFLDFRVVFSTILQFGYFLTNLLPMSANFVWDDY